MSETRYERLPHLDRIQSSFSHHDVRSVRAHLGQEAAEANRSLSAEAFTFGDRVVFAGAPSLQTAAHEAAHVIQQRRGIGNDAGQPGDIYEKHADAVADLVLMGKPAGALLDQLPGSGDRTRAGSGQVQMQPRVQPTVQQMPEIPGLREAIKRWAATDLIKEPIVRALAKAYVKRPGRFEIADIVVRDTPYGGDRVIPGVHEPTEDRVFIALMPVIDLKKTGKGEKDWSFQWADEAAPQKKTADEQLGEIAKFGVKQGADKVSKKLKNPTLKFAVEYATDGTVSPVSLIDEISEPVGEWIMKDVLRLSAEVVGKAVPVIGWLWLAYDVVELAISLGEPPEKELRPYQEESANIVAAVKGYLEGKKEAARPAEEGKRLFNPEIRFQNDNTTVVNPRFRER